MSKSRSISFPVAPGDTIWLVGNIPRRRLTEPQMVKVAFVMATAEGKYIGTDTGAIIRSNGFWCYTEEEAKIVSKQINNTIGP